ncbi:MAG: SRPBCC family protein [Opitutae bacterium]|nr:SRPBCC family protein [Opitutae bacterium]
MKKLIITLTAIALLSLRASAAPLEGSEPRYTSHYRHTDQQIGDFVVDQSTTAPLQIVLMARLNVPPVQAFDLVSRQLTAWVAQIPHVEWDHKNSAAAGECGKGSVRVCDFGKDKIVENIAYWKEGSIYAYKVASEHSTAPFPIKNHLGIFIVESDGSGGSLITWRQYFNRKFSLMAPMVRWGMRAKVMEPGLRKLIEQHGGELVKANF